MEKCIFSKNDHLKLCEFHLPKKKKLVYKIIVFTVTSSVKEMAWYYLDGNEMDLVKKLIDDGNDVKFYAGSQINKDNETTYEEYLKQEGVNITPNVRFDTLEKANLNSVHKALLRMNRSIQTQRTFSILK